MDDRLAKELRAAIDQHSDSPELRELWLRVLGLQLLSEDLSRPTNPQSKNADRRDESESNESVDPSLVASSKSVPSSDADGEQPLSDNDSLNPSA